MDGKIAHERDQQHADEDRAPTPEPRHQHQHRAQRLGNPDHQRQRHAQRCPAACSWVMRCAQPWVSVIFHSPESEEQNGQQDGGYPAQLGFPTRQFNGAQAETCPPTAVPYCRAWHHCSPSEMGEGADARPGRSRFMLALVCTLAFAFASAGELVNQVYTIPADEWRYVDLGIGQRPDAGRSRIRSARRLGPGSPGRDAP